MYVLAHSEINHNIKKIMSLNSFNVLSVDKD